jgi:hypothetical protein
MANIEKNRKLMESQISKFKSYLNEGSTTYNPNTDWKSILKIWKKHYKGVETDTGFERALVKKAGQWEDQFYFDVMDADGKDMVYDKFENEMTRFLEKSGWDYDFMYGELNIYPEDGNYKNTSFKIK